MNKIKFSFIIIIFLFGSLAPTFFVHASNNNPKNAVVEIKCVNESYEMSQGSGVIVSPDGKIITNAHVVASDPSKLWGCWGGIITEEDSYKPNKFFNINFFHSNITNDLAFGKIDQSLDGNVLYLSESDILDPFPYLKLNFNSSIGQEIKAYGYPGISEGNLNITEGKITSKPMVNDYKYLFSDVGVSYGNSGGAVVNKNNELLGLPTSVNSSDLAKNTYILDVNSLKIEKEWLKKIINANSGSNFIDNWEKAINFIDDILKTNEEDIDGPEENTDNNSDEDSLDEKCRSIYGEGSRYYEDLENKENSGCYCEKGYEWNNGNKTQCVKIESRQEQIEEEKALVENVDKNLARKLSGKILLQVEKNGEGWYIFPNNNKKYFLGKPIDAFNLMRDLGLGVEHDELHYYLNSNFPNKLSGKIVLDVENNGEAYYVNPDNLKGYSLGRPREAFEVMRDLGTGITNKNIRKIAVGELK